MLVLHWKLLAITSVCVASKCGPLDGRFGKIGVRAGLRKGSERLLNWEWWGVRGREEEGDENHYCWCGREIRCVAHQKDTGQSNSLKTSSPSLGTPYFWRLNGLYRASRHGWMMLPLLFAHKRAKLMVKRKLTCSNTYISNNLSSIVETFYFILLPYGNLEKLQGASCLHLVSAFCTIFRII